MKRDELHLVLLIGAVKCPCGGNAISIARCDGCRKVHGRCGGGSCGRLADAVAACCPPPW